MSEQSSGRIVDIQGDGLEFFEVRDKLLEFATQLFSALATEFLFSRFERVHGKQWNATDFTIFSVFDV